MKTLESYMDRDVHARPRLHSYGWIAKMVDFDGEMLVILYGAMMAGQGSGQTLIGPEHNGIAILDRDGTPLARTLGKITSGYFGPSSDQLALFDRLYNMTPDQIRDWHQLNNFDLDLLQYYPSCPICEHNLILRLDVVVETEFTVSGYGDLQFTISEETPTEVTGINMMYCPNCGEEWFDSDTKGVPVPKFVVDAEHRIGGDDG